MLLSLHVVLLLAGLYLLVQSISVNNRIQCEQEFLVCAKVCWQRCAGCAHGAMTQLGTTGRMSEIDETAGWSHWCVTLA
jgi:hypothetical protein